MATPASTRDLSKAINAYIHAPSLPLPDDLNRVLAAYLEKHEKYDEGASDRLQDELTSIFHKSVAGQPDRYAPFLAVLRSLRPALRTPARIVQWWDRFIDPVLDNLNMEKGLANEALRSILELLAFEEDEYDKPPSTGPNIFADRLLSRWMQLNALNQAATGSGSSDSKERFMQEAIMIFGKKDPKSFLTALNGFLIKKDYRNRCLNLLCEFVQSQPPHLHTVLQTPLFENILKSLQQDDSTTTVSLGLVSLFMLLPNMPSSLVPYLPTLFNIYARLLFWDRDRSFAQEHTQWEAEATIGGASTNWEKCLFDNDLDGDSIHHLSAYFTILYGLYPLNFVDYIRKPQRYLRHANFAEDIDVQAMEIRDRSERFRRCHLLHPNFYQLTIESERTDFSRWIKCEPAEVITDCMNLCPSADPGPGTDMESSVNPMQEVVLSPSAEDNDSTDLGMPLLSRTRSETSPQSLRSNDQRHASLAESISPRDSSSAHQSLGRKASESSHPSTRGSAEARPREPVSAGGDSPTLPPHLVTSSSHTQLQDMINSNKVIKTGLHQSLGNDSVPSLALSLADSLHDRISLSLAPAAIHHRPQHQHHAAAELAVQIAQLQRQNLLLQNDLNFERYMKQQHMAHIGELRRKQLREAATEAETQNLIMANRSLKHQLGEAKRAEGRIKKESENRRGMSSKWEAQLANKLRLLREEQKGWKVEEGGLKAQLADARREGERLRKIVAGMEEEHLRSRQDEEAYRVGTEKIRQLKEELERLAVGERRYQGLETQMMARIGAAAEAESRAQEKLLVVEARERKLLDEKRAYEGQIAVLKAKLAEAAKRGPGQERQEGQPSEERRKIVEGIFEGQLAALQARHAELQRQYGMLRRKYTVAQSSLLDLHCDIQEKKNAAVSSSFETGLTSPGASSPMNIRSKGPRDRGLSDPEVFEGTSFNATAPLEPVSASLGAGALQRPSTPTRSGGPGDESRTSPQGERYFGRGGVQNSLRKEQKKAEAKKEEKSDKKEKKAGVVMRGFRNLV